MKLYGTPPTRAIRPLWLLNELALDFEMIMVDVAQGGHLQPSFRAINPFGTVPVLVDGDVTLAESAAISLYLAERYGNGRFIPSTIDDRARMQQWIFFLVTEIEQPMWRCALHKHLYAEAERRPEECALAERDCRRFLAPMERHMTGREYFVGSDLSVADFIGAYTLDWADMVGFLDQSPNLRGFVERMYERKAAPPRIDEAFAVLHGGGVPSARRHAG